MKNNDYMNESSMPVKGQINDKSSKSGIQWQFLNQHHDCYDKERIDKLNILLHGNAATDGNAKLFMKKMHPESDEAYRDRLSFATYENNFGEIINDYGSTLFSKPLAVHAATDAKDTDTEGDEPDESEPYMQFQQHFTLDDQTMPDFMHNIQTESNALSYAYFGVDFKDDGRTPYCYYIDPCSVLDWEKDDTGKFIFLVLRNDETIRTSVKQLRDEITTTFTVWKDIDGKITVDQYRITYKIGQEPKSDEMVEHYSDGSRDDLSFREIPVVECFTPDNISIGKLIGQMAGSLFARYSTFLFCLNRGINPLLVYKQGAELPMNGDLSAINEDDERGANTVKRVIAEGKAVIGPTDELDWKSPDAKAYNTVQIQLEKDKNELYRLTASLNSIIGHTGFSTAQTKASGIAKLIDNINKEHMLGAYAKLVKKWVIKAFTIAFDSLQEEGKKSEVIWQCKGMDNYRIVDEDQLMAKIEALPLYKQNMPSQTSYKQYVSDIAYDAHPFTNIGTLDKILKEISDNIDSMDLDTIHQTANPEGTMAADSAKQLNKAVPQQDGQPRVNAPGGSDLASQPKQIGESGHQVSPEGAHIQQTDSVDPQVVYDLLKGDYPEKVIKFLLGVNWTGPLEVPLESIDFHNKENWEAFGRTEKIEEFKTRVEDEGWSKPIILVNEASNNNKMVILDGHTRALAYQEMGKPIPAYVGHVGKITDEMKKMHDLQKSGESGGNRKEK